MDVDICLDPWILWLWLGYSSVLDHVIGTVVKVPMQYIVTKRRYTLPSVMKIRIKLGLPIYSGPSLKGHSLERTPLYKGHKFLAESTMNVCNAPSHQRTPL